MKVDGGAPVLFDHSGTLLHEREGRDDEDDDGQIFGKDGEAAQQRVGRRRHRAPVLPDLHLCSEGANNSGVTSPLHGAEQQILHFSPLKRGCDPGSETIWLPPRYPGKVAQTLTAGPSRHCYQKLTLHHDKGLFKLPQVLQTRQIRHLRIVNLSDRGG